METFILTFIDLNGSFLGKMKPKFSRLIICSPNFAKSNHNVLVLFRSSNCIAIVFEGGNYRPWLRTCFVVGSPFIKAKSALLELRIFSLHYDPKTLRNFLPASNFTLSQKNK